MIVAAITRNTTYSYILYTYSLTHINLISIRVAHLSLIIFLQSSLILVVYFECISYYLILIRENVSGLRLTLLTAAVIRFLSLR